MKLKAISLGVFSLMVTSSFAIAQSAFIDVTMQAGINHLYTGYEYGGGTACADFNNDGYLDLFVLAGVNKPNLLYLNKKNGTFAETGTIAGLADSLRGVGAVAGDVDNDGDLDLYVVNYLAANKLYLNDGNAHFTDATIAAGVGDDGPGIGAAMADYNHDGLLDIYVINRSTTNYGSVFYRNNGDGTFKNVTLETKTRVVGRSLGVGFFDYDLDGDQVLKITEPSGPTGVNEAEKNLQTPPKFALLQNFPNPFNPTTTVRYQLDKAGEVSFKIVNVSGQLIQSFDLGWKNAGEYTLNWDGKNQNGVRVPSGVYFYQVSARGNGGAFRSEVKKMVLLE